MTNQIASQAAARTRRSDPERKQRIINCCLDVIAETGVAGASHRKIAAAADVPLGSMTYHFNGMDDLLREAFTQFASSVGTIFERRMAEAADSAAAKEAVVKIITEDVLGHQRTLILTQELYTLAAHDDRFRDITNTWMKRSRGALEQRFDSVTARLLDALIEGLTLHRALDNNSFDSRWAIEGVNRITSIPPLPTESLNLL